MSHSTENIQAYRGRRCGTRLDLGRDKGGGAVGVFDGNGGRWGANGWRRLAIGRYEVVDEILVLLGLRRCSKACEIHFFQLGGAFRMVIDGTCHLAALARCFLRGVLSQGVLADGAIQSEVGRLGLDGYLRRVARSRSSRGRVQIVRYRFIPAVLATCRRISGLNFG